MVRSPDEIISYLTDVLQQAGEVEAVPPTLPGQAAFFERFCQEVPVDLAREARMSAMVFAASPEVLGRMCGLVRLAHHTYGGFLRFLESPLRESVLNAVRDREHLRENLSRIVEGPLTAEGAKALLSGTTRLVVALEQEGQDIAPVLVEVAGLLGRLARGGVTKDDTVLLQCLFLGV